MKPIVKGLLLIIISFCFSTSAYSQWTTIGPDSGETSFCLSFDDSGGNLFLGTAEGFWYYNINSGTWTRREDVGWIGRSVFSLAAHQTVPGRIITGRKNAFFKGYLEYSNDWGVTGDLSYFADGGEITDIKNLPGSPNTFFACTWQDISPGEFLKSTDGGLTWVLQPNYIHFTMTEIAIDKNNPNVMYVSGDERVTKSTNGGVSWVISSNGLPGGLGVYAVSVSPANGQILLASNDNGIYRSSDAGANWTLVNGNDSRHFEFNPVNANYVAAVTFSPVQILLSSDAGLTWSDFTSNFSGDETMDLAFNTSGTKLYVTSRMDGVFVHDFSFVPVELLSFTGVYDNNKVILNWETATELNNKGFEIERNTGNNIWSIIGFVEGKGSTSTVSSYVFTNEIEMPGSSTLKYRLKQIDYDGTFSYSPEVEVTISPSEYMLEQNYPNPFNPETRIKYSISKGQQVELSVYDVIGNEVARLVDQFQAAGLYTVNFNAAGLSSGMYFYKLKTGDFVEIRKMTLLK